MSESEMFYPTNQDLGGRVRRTSIIPTIGVGCFLFQTNVKTRHYLQ